MVRHIVIDTDVGADDAVAICYAIKQMVNPSSPDKEARPVIKGFTTVFGNVTVQQATKNVQTILQVFNRTPMWAAVGQIPVHPGADGPLIRPDENKVYGSHTYAGYGIDGMGGATDPGGPYAGYAVDLTDSADSSAKPEHAASYLVRTAHQYRGELIVVALGPLTNIAMACRMDPSFMSNVARIVVMGGSVLSMGNMSRTAEFNFFMDPEAARIVFSAAGKTAGQLQPKIWLAPMETCQDHAFDWSFYDRIKGLGTVTSNFFRAFTKDLERHCRPAAPTQKSSLEEHASSIVARALLNKRKADFLFNPWDLFAMVPALEPATILEFLDAEVSVIAEGEAKGTCTVGWTNARLGYERTPVVGSPNCRIILQLDRHRMQEMVLHAYGNT